MTSATPGAPRSARSPRSARREQAELEAHARGDMTTLGLGGLPSALQAEFTNHSTKHLTEASR